MSAESLLLLKAFTFAIIAAFIVLCAVRVVLIWLDYRRRQEWLRQSSEPDWRNTLMAEAADKFGPKHPYGATSISEYIREVEAMQREQMSDKPIPPIVRKRMLKAAK